MTTVTKVSPVSVAYPESNDAGFTRYLTLCRIETKDGVVGWGECIPMSGSGFPEACRATEAMIEGLADLVEGSDPVSNLEIVSRIKKRTWWYGPEGIARVCPQCHRHGPVGSERQDPGISACRSAGWRSSGPPSRYSRHSRHSV